MSEIFMNLQGRVGTEVEYRESTSGVPMASFRLASTPRHFDKDERRWVDKTTTWLTIECWRALAENVRDSLAKGQPVLVNGKLRTSEWQEGGETRRRHYIDAYTVGHDLARGAAKFTKNEVAPAQPTRPLDDEMRQLASTVESVPFDDDHDEEAAPFGARPGVPVGAAQDTAVRAA